MENIKCAADILAERMSQDLRATSIASQNRCANKKIRYDRKTNLFLAVALQIDKKWHSGLRQSKKRRLLTTVSFGKNAFGLLHPEGVAPKRLWARNWVPVGPAPRAIAHKFMYLHIING